MPGRGKQRLERAHDERNTVVGGSTGAPRPAAYLTVISTDSRSKEWHVLEVYLKKGTNDGRIQIWLDGTSSSAWPSTESRDADRLTDSGDLAVRCDGTLFLAIT
jgi:hypothetical protein